MNFSGYRFVPVITKHVSRLSEREPADFTGRVNDAFTIKILLKIIWIVVAHAWHGSFP